MALERYEEFRDKIYPLIDDLGQINYENIIHWKYRITVFKEKIIGQIRDEVRSAASSYDRELFFSVINEKLVGLRDEWFDCTSKTPIHKATGIPCISTNSDPQGRFVYLVYKAIKALLIFIVNLQKKKNSKSSTITSDKNPSTIINIGSFTLTPECSINSIALAFNYLNKNHFFYNEPSEDNFLACFSGEEVNTKIVWKSQVSMVYFIRQLDNKGAFKSPGLKWKIAANCFLAKKPPILDANNLGRTHLPGEKTGHYIDEAMKLIHVEKNVNKNT